MNLLNNYAYSYIYYSKIIIIIYHISLSIGQLKMYKKGRVASSWPSGADAWAEGAREGVCDLRSNTTLARIYI